MVCDVDSYDKYHVTMPDDASSGTGIPIWNTSSKEVRLSLGHKINCIGNWLQCFEVNYDNRIVIYNRKMSDLFKTIAK